MEIPSRNIFVDDAIAQRRRLGNAPGDLDAADRNLAIALVGKVIRDNRRVGERVRRADHDLAAAVRAQLADRRGECRERVYALAGLVRAQRLHVELDVRTNGLLAAAG